MTDTPPTPIVFLDVETTGLGREDQIWEIAAVRRDVDGSVVTETELHLFVEHNEDLCHTLPEPFRTDHRTRFPGVCSGRVASPRYACTGVADIFAAAADGTRPVAVGINPAFDLAHLSRLIRSTYPHWPDDAPWDYTPVDARHLAVGALAATPPRIMLGFDGTHDAPSVAALRQPLTGILHVTSAGITASTTAVPGPPWRSEDVSRALGINPDDYARHTALGDVRWAMAIYDAVINPTPKEVTT